jgi:predicted small lipoprotein YifL
MQLKPLLILIGMILTLSACGQKGPLLLKEPVKVIKTNPINKDKTKVSESTENPQLTSKE